MSVTFNFAEGTANFVPRDFVNNQPGAAAASTSEEDLKHGKRWIRVFLIMSAISMGLIIANSILHFITLNIGPSTTFLDVYLIILCFFAFTAELRQIECLRGVIYKWIRYLYFLTRYTGRGLFYIFLGTLAFGDSIMQYVAAAIAIVLGLLMVGASLCVRLPRYDDPELAREEAAAGAGHALFSKSTAAAEYRFHVPEQAAAAKGGEAKGGYKPPGINEGPNAL